jgi:hypothetical protein
VRYFFERRWEAEDSSDSSNAIGINSRLTTDSSPQLVVRPAGPPGSLSLAMYWPSVDHVSSLAAKLWLRSAKLWSRLTNRWSRPTTAS